ncbi:sulfatase-like hydrolase/transferase [Cohnella mopanensis]|uniref:sulfatase-like hydrolase/transferase n=1 Tax=Cohnella mopanensis TaxID=2911966 RepID=UPI001EF9987C|nr:sulfatase-like hydrolase/transferase [Cohnella mopanensis]
MSRKPNILFILSDQHRYDSIGYSRDYPVKTPNLDRLAEEGIAFTNAYTPIPLCCPARQALLAGVRPETFNAFWNADLVPNGEIDPNGYTWTKELQNNGYQTGYVGKWHVHQNHQPDAFGFGDYRSERDYREYRKSKLPDEQPPTDLVKWFFGGVDPVALEDTRTHWLADQAIELIEKYSKSDEPWHLRLDFPEPHLPCQPHQSFLDLYDGENIPQWRSFPDTFENKPYIQKQQLLNWRVEDYTWDDWEPVVRRYYAIISQMDAAIGLVLEKLKSLGLEDDTIVVYSTDHGDMCGGHRMMDKHYILYDDVIRVPLIVKYPAAIAAGQRSEEFVYNLLDLPPTLLELAGLPVQSFFQGRSLQPLLQGQTPDDWRKDIISTYNGQQFGLYIQRAIRTERYKYVWNMTDIDELYDLHNDPGELRNVIGDSAHTEALSELRARLYKGLKDAGDPFLKFDLWLKSQLTENRKILT